MNKRKKAITAAIAAICVLLCLWAAVFLTDYICVSKAREPVFARIINNGGDPVYKGFGYTVEMEYNGINIEQITMYSAFDTVINAVILCY